MNENLNNIIFSNYLHDKKIIIVGPAKYLIGKKMGTFIDNFDIVIRIKKGFPINPDLKEDLGTKTNILLSSLKTSKVKDINRKKYNQNNFNQNDIEEMNKLLNFVLFPYPTTIEPFSKFYNQYNQLTDIKTLLITGDDKIKEYTNLKKILKTTPTIFLCSLFYLMFFKFKELYIIGITFQKDGYYKEYKTEEMFKSSQKRTLNKNKNKDSVHDMEKEIYYFKNLLNKNKNIKIDNYLKKNILNIT